jgi:probable phosphoglycerate mutase
MESGKLLQGWKDSPLTKKGSEHAILLGKRLADIPFLTIYTSPSGRAVQTAKLIRLERDISIVKKEGLKELNFG